MIRIETIASTPITVASPQPTAIIIHFSWETILTSDQFSAWVPNRTLLRGPVVKNIVTNTCCFIRRAITTFVAITSITP
jgi:hypothetical protein